jgi:hypothetical protein
MGLVLAFLIGYSAGGRAGHDDLDEVIASARAIMSSEEFRDFVRVLRGHMASVLTDLSSVVAPDSGAQLTSSVLERVQNLVLASARFRPTSA